MRCGEIPVPMQDIWVRIAKSEHLMLSVELRRSDTFTISSLVTSPVQVGSRTDQLRRFQLDAMEHLVCRQQQLDLRTLA